MTMQYLVLSRLRLSRRAFAAGCLVTPFSAAFLTTVAQEQLIDPATLKPGEFRCTILTHDHA